MEINVNTVLVAGYGNIGKSLQNVSNYHHLDYAFEYIDENINGSVEECLRAGKYDCSIDTLVNLTGCTSKEILLMCNDRNINYIDTGTEANSITDGIDLPSAFNAFKNIKLNTKAIIGAGMNPGLIEVIYAKHRPIYRHVALEIEMDSALSDDSAFFNTWSPASFYTEFCINNTFYYDQGLRTLNKMSYQTLVELQIESATFRFHLVPHEEVLSIARSNDACELSAFLYSPPSKMQAFLMTSSEEHINGMIESIPVYHEITGEDCVGILIHNLENPTALSRYYYNSANHQECYRRYGINGTSWQVACGILSALHVIHSLPEHKVYTMTDVANRYCDDIVEFLSTIGFYIGSRDFTMCHHLIHQVQDL